MVNNNNIYDYLFAGAGASATLLLLSMERKGLLAGKKIALYDPALKIVDDKTFCFWCEPHQTPAKENAHLISHRWQKASVNQRLNGAFAPMWYYYIASIDLYNELHRMASLYNINIINEAVLNIKAENNNLQANTTNQIVSAKNIFDSRPPKYSDAKKNEVFLVQSFVGFKIEVERELSSFDCVDLMDFGIEQQDATQFMYVLPFSSKTLLVELTRFGKTSLNQNESEAILHTYIQNRFGDFKKLDTEIGYIPMSSQQIDVIELPNLIVLGSRAGAVKPSTGYAFKNMSIQAENITNSIVQGKAPIQIDRKARFLFYDRLLLLILAHQPEYGKLIFNELFKKNKLVNVLYFLDEKTNLLQDMRIFISLPFKPFFVALFIDIKARFSTIVNPFFVMLTSFFMWICYQYFPLVFCYLEPIVLGLGLLLVGIPHGAVDHLLNPNDIHKPIDYKFIVSYLAMSLLYLIGWYFLPNVSLLFFLGYSVWHFGQADMLEWKPKISNNIAVVVWGSLMLAIILLGHVNETNAILKTLRVFTISCDGNIGKLLSFVMVLIFFIWSMWEQKMAMILCAIMLAIGMYLPLMSAFGLYFIGQHSVTGWLHLKTELKTNNIDLYRKALPFTSGAVFLFLGLLYAFANKWLAYDASKWLGLFFVFIACISLPHILVMHTFYKTKNDIRESV